MHDVHRVGFGAGIVVTHWLMRASGNSLKRISALGADGGACASSLSLGENY